MDCKQVSRLSLLYCDNALSSHVAEELERHLNECPECARLIDYTRREADALRFDADVPVPGPDFTRRVMESVAKLNKPFSHSKPAKTNKKPGLIKTAYFMASLVACFLLIAVLVPGTRYFNQVNSSPNAPVSDTAGQPEFVTRKSPVSEKAQSLQKFAQSPDDMGLRNPAIKSMKTEDNSAASSTSAPAGTSLKPAPAAAGSETLFAPAYIPAGFVLTRSMRDSSNNIVLTYENQTRAYFTITVIPLDKTETKFDAAAPEEPNYSQSLPSSDSQQVRSLAGVSGPAAVADSSSQEQKITTIAANIKLKESSFRVEVAGSLPAEELNRIASSIKSAE